VIVRFRGREIEYTELGRNIMADVAKDLQDVGTIEQHPNLEGWSMIMLLTPAH
jgi:translation initiation factor IF-3